ncbi:aspartate kinase [Catalinimonas alkaloidigena]|uniref:Aspartate kinase n=1 Tax=Catalinimonas alkaloidigena TaxID=1075417 RepID=A0A1G8X5R3_9BACT|nr:bifunctional aspartate kinase/homoserine dehydrogenase I [Catalinimonas alkaloidigena]SDJ85090.1 aspartate kinase [Catalinimonas alkaloidigena]
MKVLKFGGTSVQGPSEIKQVGSIVQQAYQENSTVVVVLSAMSKVTDQLIGLARQAVSGDAGYLQEWEQLTQRHDNCIRALFDAPQADEVSRTIHGLLHELKDVLQGLYLVRELTPKSLDFVMSFGERLSSRIISQYLATQGLPTEWLDSRNLIVTDRNFNNARVDFGATNARIAEAIPSHAKVVVMPGFIAATREGETTTLGRGGSDYTASIVAAALPDVELEIWTDVDGMMTADPRKVRRTFPLPRLSYLEALELSHFGAKVLYPPSVQPVLARNIPLRIKNTHRPEAEGTLITDRSDDQQRAVKGISSIDHIVLVSLKGSGMVGVTGIAMRFFSALALHQVNVILITQASSEHSITVAITPADAERAQQGLQEEFKTELAYGQVDPILVEDGLSVLAIVGENMRNTPNVAGRLFSVLGKNGVNVRAIAQGSSEHNISCVIEQDDIRKALNVVHEAFFLSDIKILNLFLIGTGTVGGTFLNQLHAQRPHLLEAHGLDIRVVGIANRRRMQLAEDGFDLASWPEQGDDSGQPTDPAVFAREMHALNLSNSILIDCTGSAAIVELYEEALRHGISIVTPNKIACSGPYDRYQRLKQMTSRRGVRFLYETNVGAGLPVIGTLQDLIQSGDRILKIEAILSGTLNYLFNEHKEGVAFSDVVKTAQRLGYSEPDPRIDLNGVDVARKILILAREAGSHLELSDVVLHNFLPEDCREAATVDAFFTLLPNYDAHFENMRQEAEKAGKRQRYVATYEEGKLSCGLRTVGPEHPFFQVEGNDNMVLFTTERYQERPLIVKGAGAGAEVTAAGVFADIIRAGNF